MNKELKDIMKFLNGDLNTKIDSYSIGYLTYHMISASELSSDYNKYKVRRFLSLYRIESLFDNKIITKKERKILLELFDLQDKIETELSDIFRKERLNNVDSELEKKENKLIKQIQNIEKIFNKYHLLDEIKIDKYILDTLSVDNKELNLEEEIKKIR